MGTIGVGAGVCHGEKTGFGMLQFEVFVCEFLTIDGFSTGAAIELDEYKYERWVLVTSEIAALEHEVRNDTVEGTACVAL